MRDLIQEEVSSISGGSRLGMGWKVVYQDSIDPAGSDNSNGWSTPDPSSGQSCLNEMVEGAGIAAIGAAAGTIITGGSMTMPATVVGGVLGGFNSYVNSKECEDQR